MSEKELGLLLDKFSEDSRRVIHQTARRLVADADESRITRMAIILAASELERLDAQENAQEK